MLWVVPGQLSPGGYASRPFSLGDRLLTEPRVILHYIAWSLVPNPHALSLYHDDFPVSHSLLSPPTTLFSIAGVAALVIAALWLRRRQPLVSLGLLWFFTGQLLTATIFNLELVYEHRNYLPSLGLLLAAFSILALTSPVTRIRAARCGLAVGLIGLFAGITAMRVQQWSNPLRYAAIAAAEHPNSPRATYGLGRAYAVLVDGPDSRFLPLANRALEKAAAVPHSNILPEQGLLLINAKEHQPLKVAWWQQLVRKLASRPASSQDINALYALVDCELRNQCSFPEQAMTNVFAAALKENPRNPDIRAIYSNYTLNVVHNYAYARQLMVDSLRLAPRIAQYHINLIKLDIFLGRFYTARREIGALEQLNRFGRLDVDIRKLKRRLTQAQSTQPARVPQSITTTSERPTANANHASRAPSENP
ncbi:MAG: hypothetical protein P8180_08965 [Gammaproteobacteria bacterium]